MRKEAVLLGKCCRNAGRPNLGCEPGARAVLMTLCRAGLWQHRSRGASSSIIMDAPNSGSMWRFRKLSTFKLFVIVFALLYSLCSLKNCWNCMFSPGSERSVELSKEDDERYECKSTAISAGNAGFLSPSTLHTIDIEGADGDVNCWAACSLGLQIISNEPSQRECSAIFRTPAKSAVAFVNLAEGNYTVTVNCEESGKSCYAVPQDFAFEVALRRSKSGVLLTQIPLVNIKLFEKLSGQCSNEQIWRSRFTCLGVLYTLMGVVLLLISQRERVEDDFMSPRILQDIKWVLRTRGKS